jgi:hypothetical protein
MCPYAQTIYYKNNLVPLSYNSAITIRFWTCAVSYYTNYFRYDFNQNAYYYENKLITNDHVCIIVCPIDAAQNVLLNSLFTSK